MPIYSRFNASYALPRTHRGANFTRHQASSSSALSSALALLFLTAPFVAAAVTRLRFGVAGTVVAGVRRQRLRRRLM